MALPRDAGALYVRVERVVSGTAASYYDTSAEPGAEAWICASKDGKNQAFWSNVDGAPLKAPSAAFDLDVGHVTVPPDV